MPENKISINQKPRQIRALIKIRQPNTKQAASPTTISEEI